MPFTHPNKNLPKSEKYKYYTNLLDNHSDELTNEEYAEIVDIRFFMVSSSTIDNTSKNNEHLYFT